jgi:hypothetical protein
MVASLAPNMDVANAVGGEAGGAREGARASNAETHASAALCVRGCPFPSLPHRLDPTVTVPATPCPSPLKTQALPTYVSTLMFFSGFLIRFDDIPIWWKWYSYLNPLRYAWTARECSARPRPAPPRPARRHARRLASQPARDLPAPAGPNSHPSIPGLPLPPSHGQPIPRPRPTLPARPHAAAVLRRRGAVHVVRPGPRARTACPDCGRHTTTVDTQLLPSGPPKGARLVVQRVDPPNPPYPHPRQGQHRLRVGIRGVLLFRLLARAEHQAL